jgi:hypothetical protein
VFLFIVPSVVVLILILVHLTISLLNCRINMHSECDFEFSKQALVTWLFFIFIIGGNFELFCVDVATYVWPRANLQ